MATFQTKTKENNSHVTMQPRECIYRYLRT